MAKEDAPAKQETTKSSGGRHHRHKKDKAKPFTKIVIRHLPPTMTEEEFLNQIDPLPEHSDYYYVNADWSLGFDATCRAYLMLKRYDDVFLFRDRFDGYVFVDSKGVEYPAIVEFAPFQGPVKEKHNRADTKVNTIHTEAHYNEFLARLEEEREAAAKGGETKLEFSLDRKKDEKITSTPLLQYLSMKKEKRREEAKKRSEEKRRQRDEEKERSRIQVTKILNVREGGGREGRDDGRKQRDKAASGGGGGSKEEVDGEAASAKAQARKLARAKRKAERSQKHRDEQAKKQGRERDDGERGERGERGDRGDKGERGERGERHERGERGERREKDKERDKDKSGGGGGKKKQHNAKGGDEKHAGGRNKGDDGKAKGAVNDVVKNFIMSVALPADGGAPANPEGGVKLLKVTAKEFVPEMNRSEEKKEQPQDQAASSKEADALQEVREKLEQASLSSKPDSKRAEERRQQRKLAAEERRIRNKDRPSIQIYQPKPRGPQSEERELGPGREGCSNPASDCESIKKDKQRSKKVARYSERRSERRNRDKAHQGDDGAAGSEAKEKRLSKSKSTDSCGAAGGEQGKSNAEPSSGPPAPPAPAPAATASGAEANANS